MWKTRQGFCTMTLYNNFEKGCSAAWQRVCFGYKMSRVQILSSLPITSPMGSNEGSIEIDSNWTKFRVSFFYMHAKIILFFTALSPVVRKRSQFSSVERGSPKPNVVGSNPTERDSVLVMSNQKKELNKVECPTTVLNPNQRKEQKYSTWRGDH